MLQFHAESEQCLTEFEQFYTMYTDTIHSIDSIPLYNLYWLYCMVSDTELQQLFDAVDTDGSGDLR